MLLFRSTNRRSKESTIKEVILKGQAPDYGLYMPNEIPKLSQEKIKSFSKFDYPKIAYEVTKEYLEGAVEDKKLRSLIINSYNFEVPIEKVDEQTFIMRLDRGPTASFKDFAARVMARLMHQFSNEDDKKLTVLVATSGDTGGAVANAFYGLDNISVTVLFPENEVSLRQRKQMTTLGGNINAIAVKGTFDDCQEIVKQAFNDKSLDKLNLTSANSINFGRLLPQSVYYFYAISRLSGAESGDLNFSVPSGNFGNLMGGILAKAMGLPVKKFIAATNENDEFFRYLRDGTYSPVVPSKNCSSNAMNVGHPSNLARLIDFYGGWLLDERDNNGKVVKKGVMKVKPDIKSLRKDILSYSIIDKEVEDTIRSFYDKYKIIVEPHGAIGLRAAELAHLPGKTICLETADPAKFPDKIKEIIGIDPKLPKCLSALDDKIEKFKVIKANYAEFKKVLEEN